MDDCIQGLEAEGREIEQRRNILYCSAQRLLCLLSVVLFLLAVYYGKPGGCKDAGTS